MQSELQGAIKKRVWAMGDRLRHDPQPPARHEIVWRGDRPDPHQLPDLSAPSTKMAGL